tara:strand:- start:551 stop:1021 length:471 start_codon:yes stop_codon:yes gene_type:complete
MTLKTIIIGDIIMAKSGRYSANRFKVEALTADKTVDVSDCGTMFMYTETAGFTTIQLPTVADAGKGWWCRIVVEAMAGGADVDCNIAQSTSDTADIVLLRSIDGSGNAVSSIAADGATIIGNTATAGDWIELWCDGTKWYGQTFCSAAGGIIAYSA